MNHLNDISKVYLQNVASQETQEEGYKPIDKKKESAMYRRAGNLARTSLSSRGKEKEEAQDKSSKIVSAISRQKENERFAKMGDEKARDNYKEEVEQVDENVATGKARRAKFGGIAQRVGSGEAVSNQEKSDRFAKSVAAKKAALKAAGDAAHKAASDKGMSPAEAEMRRKAAERKAARAKKRQMGEALDPVGQEDADVDNDGKKNTKTDKYLLKRRKAIGKAIATRKEETEITEIHVQAHTPHEVPTKDLKGLVKKAVKRIDADVDGDVDTSDPKETEMGEFVPTADGKGKLKTKVQREGFSNWRQDLTEIITDDGEESKPIKEKKVNNKIVINPQLKESVEQLGGELISIEEVELDEEALVEFAVDSLYEEFLEEGYDEDTIEEVIESAIREATVTYGHDTRKPKTSAQRADDRVSAVARFARAKIKKYAKKAVVGGARAVAKGATKLANKVERDNPNTFSGKKKPRSASPYRGQGVGRKEKVGATSTAAPAATKTPKSSRSTAQKSQSAKTKAKKNKLDDLLSSIRNEAVDTSEYKKIAKEPAPKDDKKLAYQFKDNKRRQRDLKKLARLVRHADGQKRNPAMYNSYEPEGQLVDEGIGMTMANAIGNPPALSKRMKLKQALLNREINKETAKNKKRKFSGKAAVSEEETPAERLDRISREKVAAQKAVADAKKKEREDSAAAFQAHKKEVLAKGDRPVDALDSWQKKKMKKEEVEHLDEMPYQVMGSPDGKKEKKIGKPVKSKKYADARASELADTHKATGGKYRSQYVEDVEQVDEKLNMKKEKMGDVIKDFYKSDAPQFKGKSKEKRREMAIAAKLTAERGGKKLGEGATETSMSPQELQLQKRKTQIDLMISRKRRQALDKQGKEGSVSESAEDRLRDQRMERGGVDGNTRYDRPPAKKATNAELGIGPGKTAVQKQLEKKYGKGASAMDIVKAEIRAKHGKGAITDKK